MLKIVRLPRQLSGKRLRLPINAGDAGDTGTIPRSGRSPGGVSDNPFQFSCLENPVDRGACWATVHGVVRVRCDLATKQQQLGEDYAAAASALPR